MTFKLWSETSEEASEELHPDIGLRRIDDLSAQERSNLAKSISEVIEVHGLFDHLPYVIQGFCDSNIRYLHHFPHRSSISAYVLVDIESWLGSTSHHQVLELLSFLAQSIGVIKLGDRSLQVFCRGLNMVFDQLGINVLAEKNGFIPKTEKVVSEQVYKPVLAILAINPELEIVNNELRKAFDGYLLGTKKGYSDCVTHSVNAVHACLQILVGDVGRKKTFGQAISEVQTKNILSTTQACLLRPLESYLQRSRKEKSSSHPTKSDPDEGEAMLVLDLSLVYLKQILKARNSK